MNISLTCNRFDGSRTVHHGFPGITEIYRFGTALAEAARRATNTKTRGLVGFVVSSRFSPRRSRRGARPSARATPRRTAHAASVRLPRQRSKVGAPSAVLLSPRSSRSPRSFRGLRRAREARPAISSHPPRASDAIGSGKMAEGLQINPDKELKFRCASPIRGVVHPARPARDLRPPRPALVVPPGFALHFSRARRTPRSARARPDPPPSLTRPSPAAPSDSQSSSRSRSRRRSACTTPAPPRWPSR
jgi:hypothetical protein